MSRTYLTGEYRETKTHKVLQEVNKETNKITNNSQIAWGDDDVIQRKKEEMGIEVGNLGWDILLNDEIYIYIYINIRTLNNF